MSEKPYCPAVPNPRAGTAGQSLVERHSGGTEGGTESKTSLRALALLALRRDNERDRERDNSKSIVPGTGTPVGQCPGLSQVSQPACPTGLAETECQIISPARWAASDGPGFEEPCSERRGLVERRGGIFLHFCVECGRWGAYGYGATRSHPGRWYCRLHRPE
jgi:hypothetical protein